MLQCSAVSNLSHKASSVINIISIYHVGFILHSILGMFVVGFYSYLYCTCLGWLAVNR